jgi:hypothetical protein
MLQGLARARASLVDSLTRELRIIVITKMNVFLEQGENRQTTPIDRLRYIRSDHAGQEPALGDRTHHARREHPVDLQR